MRKGSFLRMGTSVSWNAMCILKSATHVNRAGLSTARVNSFSAINSHKSVRKKRGLDLYGAFKTKRIVQIGKVQSPFFPNAQVNCTSTTAHRSLLQISSTGARNRLQPSPLPVTIGVTDDGSR